MFHMLATMPNGDNLKAEILDADSCEEMAQVFIEKGAVYVEAQATTEPFICPTDGSEWPTKTWSPNLGEGYVDRAELPPCVDCGRKYNCTCPKTTMASLSKLEAVGHE